MALIVLITTLAVITALYYAYIGFFSPLASIPGPQRAVISRLWLAYHSQKGDMHRVIPKLHRKYGSLVRVAPNEVSVSDLKAIRDIYGPGSKYRKSDWYSQCNAVIMMIAEADTYPEGVWQGTQRTDLFAERSIPVHSALKRNISKLYSMSSLTPLEKWMDSAIECFINRMHDQGTQPIDLGKWLQLLAFDVIGEVSFSKRFGFLEAGKDDGSFAMIETALRSLAWVGQLPWIFWLDHYCAPIIGHRLGLALRHGAIRQYASREAEARKHRESDHDDILGQLYQVQRQKPEALDDHAIKSIATANVFAGSDTTSISLRAIIYFLLKNPACLERFMTEMEQRKIDGRLTFPPKFSQVADWPYLQACISEALRLHPAVGMNLPRVVPEGGTTICGKYLPAGTIVGINAWVVHQDSSVFGEDVDRFNPDRWLGDKKGDRERFFFAFGGGQRLCIGKNISMMEMSKLIPTLFNEFEIKLINPEKPLKTKCVWFVHQEGLCVTLHSRYKG